MNSHLRGEPTSQDPTVGAFQSDQGPDSGPCHRPAAWGLLMLLPRSSTERARLLGTHTHGHLDTQLMVTLAGADTGRRSEGRERFLLCSRFFS